MARILVLASFFLTSFAQTRDLNKLYEKTKFQLGTKSFEGYVADTEELRANGLMYVSKLDPDHGMLFVFEDEQPLSFWMKNTLIPLAIAFINKDGKVVDLQEMSPQSSMAEASVPTYHSRARALFALEMNKGWFSKNGIKVGARLKLIGKTKSDLLKQKLYSRH